MINQQELDISNKSYVNKDFQKLYPEILELAKQLSSKWDPSTSNESDPGVVLLKLLGFIGDKLNYNIDKNILESFMPSATQESSVRNLAEINGYFPRYYRSANTRVSFLYNGNKLGNGESFKLKAFETTVTDSSNSVVYTLVEDITIQSRFTTVSADAIEGKLETLSVNNVQEIHIANLDDNNRIYFPERFVADNGVFVQKINEVGSFWGKVDNLNTAEPGQLVFKFGFDSKKDLPYLEFPSDISNLIESGLLIKYIRTTGSNGNVKSGYLSKLSSPSQITLESDNTVVVYPDTTTGQGETSVLRISNISDSSNGEDPENLEQIYNSFKKVVGTFDTLVTSRDYANAIYNLLDNLGNNVVSNIQVADRRTDINYSNQILSFNQYGPIKVNITNDQDISPFDLCLYPLNPIITSYNSNTYINSFFPLSDFTELKSGIEDNKTISHNYKSLLPDDVYLYKNYYKLNAKISTNFKVNTFEQGSILSNINDALYRNFNSRELDYGYEIPFDSLLTTIQGADTRIKNVSLEEPELYTKVMFANTVSLENEVLLLDTTDPVNLEPYLNLLAKNVLAGRVSLFQYNNDFDFELGQIPVTLQTVGNPSDTDFIHENLVKVTTEVLIEEEDITSSIGYTLKENEYVQAIAPSLVTEVIYPAYINYHWEGDDIPEDKEHSISGDEYLIINYVDSNSNNIAIKYTSDKIVTYKVSKERVVNQDYYTSTIVSEVNTPSNIFKPVGLTLREPAEYSISGVITTKVIDFTGNLLNFNTLGTEESIEKRKFVETTLTASIVPCYWIVNGSENELFKEGDEIYEGEGSEQTLVGYERVLGENEYFIYSNSSLDSLEVLGSGTRLTLNTTVPAKLNEWKIVFSKEEEQVEISTVSERGLNAFEDYNWKYRSFNSNTDISTKYNLKIEQMSILTLSSGDNIKITPDSSEAELGDITNVFKAIPNTYEITYRIGEDAKILPVYSNSSWKIRSRLDLNTGPNLRQQILDNQTITLYLDDNGTTKTRIFNANNTNLEKFIMFNTLLQQSGGIDIDLSVTYLSGDISYDVVAYTFDYDEPTFINADGLDVSIVKSPSGYYQINLKELLEDSSNSSTISIPIVPYYDYGTRISDNGSTQLLMVHWEHPTEGLTSIDLEATYSGTGGIRRYNSGNAYTSTLSLVPGINIVELNTVSNLTFNISEPSISTDSIQLSRMSITSGFNPGLNLEFDTSRYDTLLSKISELDSTNAFFYNGALDSVSLIEFNDVSDPRAFFDNNNLANRFTLSQIDFTGSTIEIVRTSRI
jgi:hypothetical protein